MPILLPDKAKMKKLILVVILIFFAIVPLIDLMHPGLFIAHDSESHVARLASFYQSLSEGNLVPRWAANLNSGYGTPIIMFLFFLKILADVIFQLNYITYLQSLKEKVGR